MCIASVVTHACKQIHRGVEQYAIKLYTVMPTFCRCFGAGGEISWVFR
uniref:Uncharacterized protein n=1 Tax=Triticum urartu TaxID=4572 RepID=A0A8R7PU98_TRIUA